MPKGSTSGNGSASKGAGRKSRSADGDPMTSGPKGAVKTGLAFNHNKSVARDCVATGPKKAAKSGS